MKAPFTLGTIGHFGLAVTSPKRSAKWFERALGLSVEFEYEDGIAVGNENVTIALFKGKPSPETIGHMSFHLPGMTILREALEHLKRTGVEVEDPGDEIGAAAGGKRNDHPDRLVRPVLRGERRRREAQQGKRYGKCCREFPHGYFPGVLPYPDRAGCSISCSDCDVAQSPCR